MRHGSGEGVADGAGGRDVGVNRVLADEILVGGIGMQDLSGKAAFTMMRLRRRKTVAGSGEKRRREKQQKEQPRQGRAGHAWPSSRPGQSPVFPENGFAFNRPPDAEIHGPRFSAGLFGHRGFDPVIVDRALKITVGGGKDQDEPGAWFEFDLARIAAGPVVHHMAVSIPVRST